MRVSQGIRRNDGESWLAAAIRLATYWGLEVVVAEHYRQAVSEGVSDEEAAFSAVMEWQVADRWYEQDDK